MCGPDIFCFRWNLRTGAKVTLVITLVYALCFIAFCPIIMYLGMEQAKKLRHGHPMNPETRTRAEFNEFFIFTFGVCLASYIVFYLIAGLNLYFALKTNKTGYIIVWLVLIGISLIIMLLPTLLMSVSLSKKDHKDDDDDDDHRRKVTTKTETSSPFADKEILIAGLMFWLVFFMKIYMVYLWAIILNFLRVLKDGGDGTQVRRY